MAPARTEDSEGEVAEPWMGWGCMPLPWTVVKARKSTLVSKHIHHLRRGQKRTGCADGGLARLILAVLVLVLDNDNSLGHLHRVSDDGAVGVAVRLAIVGGGDHEVTEVGHCKDFGNPWLANVFDRT